MLKARINHKQKVAIMGYTTDFEGAVEVEPPLNKDEISFLKDLVESRRMHRLRGPLYVLGASDHFGNEDRSDVVDYNRPAVTQPGLWCQWEPSDDGYLIHWDGNEKFYYSVEWMQYIIENLLSEAGRDYVEYHHSGDPRLDKFTFNHVVNGEIHAQGEDEDDTWKLVVKDNIVTEVRTMS